MSSGGRDHRLVQGAEQTSDELHARVRRFAEAWEKPGLVARTTDETFEALALDIARFQTEQCPGFARLVEQLPTGIDSVAAIPAVPTDAFRLTRVAAQPPELDAVVFRTSGTTAHESGRHPVRSLSTYDELALRLGRHTLFSRVAGAAVVVALAPRPTSPIHSSLGHMMRVYMQHFDGRALTRDPAGVGFDVDAQERWLVGPLGVDVEALSRACKIARHRSEPLVVLATSFALVGLLEALDGDILPVPERCFVMHTGGFKGRSREVSPSELRSAVARAFRTPESCLLGEYGMTELTSQLYEAWPGPRPIEPDLDPVRAALEPRLSRFQGRPGIFFAPPWLRVSAVDRATWKELPDGEIGLGRFVDLGNVDSAIAVQTEDLVRVMDGGVELLGRATGANARGCSLPFEGLLK